MKKMSVESVDKCRVPQHVAIIMDGNGRWARKLGNQRLFGHRKGVNSVTASVEIAAELGVKYLTLYAFSTENWSRPKDEVEGLMTLLVSTIESETPNLNKNNVRLNAIGDLDSLPTGVLEKLLKAIENTSGNTGLVLTLALSYSARWEITKAIRDICKDVEGGKLDMGAINEQTVSLYLTTREMPDPELIIRTSGEQRISNFLLWQCAYSEFYFSPVLWPDFNKEEFIKAIVDYQKRERRFGKTSEQVKL
ncbi:undecaprenyl diphosphate synthase [Acetobacteroides hydrogenigenes]|uniref:Isoprenyl transferase n=2 Tax=Acetobacteroides hydrogenigenes TaxID=979970 RepID=A0A4R2EVA0_9BACT|nr:undecaprenyl diphosphate synthase [Acetobacteroides hydrogenigenes]